MKRIARILSAFTILALWGATHAFAAADQASLGATIQLVTPNGGQSLEARTATTISWTSTDVLEPARAEILFSTDGGNTWTPLIGGLPNSGSFSWGIPYALTGHGRIRVAVTSADHSVATDDSDADFQIVDTTPPHVIVYEPAGGESWMTGSPQHIRWKAGDASQTVGIDLEYSLDGGATWQTINLALSNLGEYDWAVPHAPSAHARVRVTAHDPLGNSAQETSNEFTIADPAPVVHAITASAGAGGGISPAGTVTVVDGATQSFMVTPDAGYHVAGVLVDGAAAGAVATYDFTNVTADHTIAASFASDDPTVAATAGAGGMIQPAGAVLVPYGTDAVFTLTANAGFRVDDVVVDGISVGATSTHTIAHVVTDHSIHATFVADPPPTAAVVSPNGGEHFWAGNPIALQWTASDDAAVTRVDLLLSRTGAAGPYETLALGVPNSGTYSWVATGPATSDAFLAVVAHDAAENQTQDASDLAFAIEVPVIHKLVSFRADSANGSGPYPVPGAGVPWVDLANDHDAGLWNFTGKPNSGWRGNGTPHDPYRLEFAGEEPGANTRVVIPSASVPELQSIGALTASVWFKTGFNGPRADYDYILEWVQQPTPDMNPEYEGRGMSIVVQNGILQVYANPWVNITPVTPNTWYHVVVVKDTSDLRVYVNGERLFSGIKSHRGIQQSELVLGCSVFRQFENTALPYADFFTGAIAQMSLSEGPMSDAMVRDLYDADRALYQPVGEDSPPSIPLASLVTLRAADADGGAPYATESAATTWVDLDAPSTNGTLVGFDGTETSGWTGDGSTAAPYALRFDGANDCVSIAAGTIAELQNVSALTTEMWIKPDASILGGDYHYLTEWLAAYGSSTGMSLAIQNGKLQVYLSNPGWTEVASISPDTWYHIVVVKGPGTVKVYLNGVETYEGNWVNIGEQTTELVLGASIWRGPGQYGDFYSGSMSMFRLWQGALTTSQVQQSYINDLLKVQAVAGVTNRASGLTLIGPRPNPVRRTLDVNFSLPTSQPATIELIDVAGRQVRAREVGSMGPGVHQVNLGHAAALNAGVYFLRLTQGEHVVTTKATIVH